MSNKAEKIEKVAVKIGWFAKLIGLILNRQGLGE